jgi:hypothetical protein
MIKKLKGWYDTLEVSSKILVNLFVRIVYFILLVLLMHVLMPDNTERHTIGFRLIVIVIGAVLLTVLFDWKKLKAILKKAEGGREK